MAKNNGVKSKTEAKDSKKKSGGDGKDQ